MDTVTMHIVQILMQTEKYNYNKFKGTSTSLDRSKLLVRPLMLSLVNGFYFV